MIHFNIGLTFSSVSELRRWLEHKADQCYSPEEYDEWLQRFFDEGTTITVHGEEYGYWDCWELL